MRMATPVLVAPEQSSKAPQCVPWLPVVAVRLHSQDPSSRASALFLGLRVDCVPPLTPLRRRGQLDVDPVLGPQQLGDLGADATAASLQAGVGRLFLVPRDQDPRVPVASLATLG